MIRLEKPAPRRQGDNTIALINIVFLMLIFFLIAGTLSPPLEDIDLVTTSDTEPAEPPRALFVTENGELRHRGQPITIAEYVAKARSEETNHSGDGEFNVRVAPAADLPAIRLIEIVDGLKGEGVTKITVVTERKLQ